jgi:hypothetical protein
MSIQEMSLVSLGVLQNQFVKLVVSINLLKCFCRCIIVKWV